MLKVISTHVFLRSRLHPGLLETITRSGAEGIEVFAARQHFDYTERAAVREIAGWFRANSIVPWAMHAPIWSDYDSGRGGEPSINVVHAEKARRIDSMDEVKRALESAEHIPFRHMVLHLGDRGDLWNGRTIENALTALEHLQAFARPLGVKLLIENLQNEVTTPAHLLEILRVGHFDDIGVCLDLGHAHIGEGVEPALSELSDALRSSHIHDNHGERDEHLWPGGGTIDFGPAFAGLNAAKQQPAGVLEIHYSLGENPAEVVEQAKQAFALYETAELS